MHFTASKNINGSILLIVILLIVITLFSCAKDEPYISDEEKTVIVNSYASMQQETKDIFINNIITFIDTMTPEIKKTGNLQVDSIFERINKTRSKADREVRTITREYDQEVVPYERNKQELLKSFAEYRSNSDFANHTDKLNLIDEKISQAVTRRDSRLESATGGIYFIRSQLKDIFSTLAPQHKYLKGTSPDKQ